MIKQAGTSDELTWSNVKQLPSMKSFINEKVDSTKNNSAKQLFFAFGGVFCWE